MDNLLPLAEALQKPEQTMIGVARKAGVLHEKSILLVDAHNSIWASRLQVLQNLRLENRLRLHHVVTNMRRTTTIRCRSTSLVLLAIQLVATVLGATASQAAEFDFPRLLACREIAIKGTEGSAAHPAPRIVEVVLPISVRFHGKDVHQVREINIDVRAASESLLVHNFAPQTLMTSELASDIQRTVTHEKSHFLEANLGGALPVVAGNLVAHVTPSIGGDLRRRHSTTEKVSRLAPKMPLVVSGTTGRGSGVFFKIKPSSQTTLEGVHELRVQFAVPPDWQSGTLRVACLAHGRHKVLGIVEQPKAFGSANATLYLYSADSKEAREVAIRRAGATQKNHGHLTLDQKPERHSIMF